MRTTPGREGLLTDSGIAEQGTDNNISKQISIDLGIAPQNQNELQEDVQIGGKAASKIGCASVAVAMIFGETAADFIGELNENGGYAGANKRDFDWDKVGELYGYTYSKKHGNFQDTRASIISNLEEGRPVIGQIYKGEGNLPLRINYRLQGICGQKCRRALRSVKCHAGYVRGN